MTDIQLDRKTLELTIAQMQAQLNILRDMEDRLNGIVANMDNIWQGDEGVMMTDELRKHRIQIEELQHRLYTLITGLMNATDIIDMSDKRGVSIARDSIDTFVRIF